MISILKNSNKVNRNLGITLVELIVVIAIMAVMIGAGVFSLSLLTGAEAKRAANNFNVQLNDIKTTTLTTAEVTVVLRYIEASDASKTAGIDKDGYYVVKEVSTINNRENIIVKYSDPEYSYIGSKKVAITIAGNSISGNDCLEFSFNRRTGEIEKANLATAASTDYNASISSGSSIMANPNVISLKSGLAEYTVTINKNGTHNLIRVD